VHDLNGEVARFAELARLLGGDRPVWGLRYTVKHETIERMAAHYLRELRTIQPAGPYRLGGWCFGAVVAFELAHQLQADGEEVALLALIGISAFDFSRLVAPAALERYRAAAPAPGRSPARSALSAARAALRHKRPATPSAVCSVAFARYLPAAYPGRAVLVLSADETVVYSTDPAADWRDLCSDGVDVLLVPGGHEQILVEPNVAEVARRLRG
jgi:thioesterase domain-containing protein